VGTGTIKSFAGTDQDVTAFEKFIERYVTVNHRWNSPKFLFGESYGTTRSAALADALDTSGMQLNGIILMSTIPQLLHLGSGRRCGLHWEPAFLRGHRLALREDRGISPRTRRRS